MRLLSNLHVKGKPAVLPGRAIRRQSHYFIYRPRRTTQKYKEQHKNTKNNTKIRKSAGRAPVFAGFILAFALQLRGEARKTLSQGCHT